MPGGSCIAPRGGFAGEEPDSLEITLGGDGGLMLGGGVGSFGMVVGGGFGPLAMRFCDGVASFGTSPGNCGGSFGNMLGGGLDSLDAMLNR
jgi:hypothetical protein